MKVTGAKVTETTTPVLPFWTPMLPFCQRLLPNSLAGVSTTLLKATALEIAILAGRLLLYPSGITQERRVPPPPCPAPEDATPRPISTRRSATSSRRCAA